MIENAKNHIDIWFSQVAFNIQREFKVFKKQAAVASCVQIMKMDDRSTFANSGWRSKLTLSKVF